MKKALLPAFALMALFATAGCHRGEMDNMLADFSPATGTTYAPHNEGYTPYVNGFTGTDTHVFKVGDRSFTMRGTPPFAGNVEPWFDWNETSGNKGAMLSLASCGDKCQMAVGAQAFIKTRSLKGYSARLEICYDTAKKDPVCYKGPAVAATDGSEWLPISVTTPMEDFKALSFRKAHIRLAVEGEPAGYQKTNSEGVIWGDDFHFQLASMDKTGMVTTKLSGAFWPDDYTGWKWKDNGWSQSDYKTAGTAVNK